MAQEVKLPRLGQGMESGTIVRWLKAEGEQVEKGEPLYEVDTDKATQEVEAEASGVLLQIAVASGEVPVGQTVAVIGEAGEEAAIAGGRRRARRPPTAPATVRPKRPLPSAPSRRSSFRAVVNGGCAKRSRRASKASPLARRIARERGIELGELSGTGPDGRIVAEDVERARRQGRQRSPPRRRFQAAPVALPARSSRFR